MASIGPKRPDGSYRARYVDPATGKEHARHFKTKAKAQEWLDQSTTEGRTGVFADPRLGRATFHDFAREWADAQEWKITTRQGFPPVLARAERVLPEGIRLAHIDQLTIKRVRVELGKLYAPATVKLTMSYVNGIMRSAFDARRIPADPTVGTRSRKARARDADAIDAMSVPTRSEVSAIWAGAPSSYRAAIALGSAGLRVGEVLGLTADRVDVESRLVTVDRQLQRIGNAMTFTDPKREKKRTIRVPSAVALELRRHLRDHDDGLLFRTPRSGEPMRRDQFYASAWRPALVGAGLPADRFVFHSLRHFCASAMLAEGVNPMAVAGHLGDALETLQRVYSHWLRDDRDVPADALERILVPLPENRADFSRTNANSGA